MANRNYQLGQLNPIVYFEDKFGNIALPPSTEMARQVNDKMRKRGYELREAGTLAEVDRLQKRMQETEYRNSQRAIERDQHTGSRIAASIRSRLYGRMISAGTSAYEKEFIKIYLQLREDKRDKYQERFKQDQYYFEAREFNESSRHMQSAVDRIPDSKDTECKSCHTARRQDGDYCVRCATELRQQLRG